MRWDVPRSAELIFFAPSVTKIRSDCPVLLVTQGAKKINYSKGQPWRTRCAVTVLSDSHEPIPYDAGGDWELAASDGLADDVERFLAACERSDQIFANASLDDIVSHSRHGEQDVRWVMIHMVEEYAQHNGHADIIRELIDGTTAS